MMSSWSMARQQLFGDSNRELWRISASLVLWAGLLLSVVSHPWVIEIFIDPLALGLSHVVAVLLQLLGNHIESGGVIIEGDAFSMEINHKCTAVYQVAVYSAGVFASRTILRNKAVGFFWGVCVISMANVVRIVGIFYVGVYAPRLIPFFHNVLGEALMILLVLITWSLWAKRISSAVPGGSCETL